MLESMLDMAEISSKRLKYVGNDSDNIRGFPTRMVFLKHDI